MNQNAASHRIQENLDRFDAAIECSRKISKPDVVVKRKKNHHERHKERRQPNFLKIEVYFIIQPETEEVLHERLVEKIPEKNHQNDG